MTTLYLLDPVDRVAWFPFHDSRPVCELRAGVWLIRERWEAIAGASATAIFGAEHLRTFTEPGVPPVQPVGPVTGPAIVGRSDFAPSGETFEPADGSARLTNDGTTVGWWIGAGDSWNGPDDGGPTIELSGIHLRGAFDLITALEDLLPPDVVDFSREGGDGVPDGSIVIGEPGDVIVLGARVEPGVVFDVQHGVIVLEQNAYVKSGTRIEGPAYIGPETEILGGQLTRVSIGPRCRVRGEINATVFLGFGNKGHDGFVGHSVIGRWANLGAGTVTSNLKNTYGLVRLQVGSGRIETERQFLGSLIGDHAKTAIGTLLPTGTVIGAGANVFDGVRPPKCVPPFAWGVAANGQLMDQETFLRVADRVMKRRGIASSEATRAMLAAIYSRGIQPLA